MITELSIKNFKSWKQIEKMRIAPITGLFGANSSGKTSILQLLLMLKQTVESPDRVQALTFGDEKSGLVNLSSFKEIIYNHDISLSLFWQLRWKLAHNLKIENPENPSAPLFTSDSLGFSSTVALSDERLYVKNLEYDLGPNTFGMIKKGQNGEKYDLSCNAGSFHFIRNQMRAWDLPAPVKCYGFPDQVKAYYQNAGFLADLQLSFEEMLGRTYYLGPLREYPKRQYTWAGSEPADMGPRGERVVDALLTARDRKQEIAMGKGKKRRLLEEHIAWWLRELGLVHSFSVEPLAKASNIYGVKVRKTASGAEAAITDVGFGVSQILPALVLCFYVPEGSTIILEQPEIHLHPSVQAGLADVFIDAVKRRKVQIIFESHSEHLLRRFQRRVAEEVLAKDQVGLYFSEIKDDHSELSLLEMDLLGNITNWPKDFFGDQFGEMAEMTKAALRRKTR